MFDTMMPSLLKRASPMALSVSERSAFSGLPTLLEAIESVMGRIPSGLNQLCSAFLPINTRSG